MCREQQSRASRGGAAVRHASRAPAAVRACVPRAELHISHTAVLLPCIPTTPLLIHHYLHVFTARVAGRARPARPRPIRRTRLAAAGMRNLSAQLQTKTRQPPPPTNDSTRAAAGAPPAPAGSPPPPLAAAAGHEAAPPLILVLAAAPPLALAPRVGLLHLHRGDALRAADLFMLCVHVCLRQCNAEDDQGLHKAQSGAKQQNFSAEKRRTCPSSSSSTSSRSAGNCSIFTPVRCW